MSVGSTRIGVEHCILSMCYVSWQYQDWSGTLYIEYVLCQLAVPGLDWNTVYCVCVMSVGSTRIGLEHCILCMCYVSWQYQDWIGTLYIVYVLCQLAVLGLEWNTVYCVCVMSVGSTRIGVEHCILCMCYVSWQ